MLFCYGSVSAARVLFPLYALSLGAQPSAVGILFAAFYAFPLVLSWPIGMLSDRIGSRGLLLLSTIIGTGAIAMPYFVRELPALYLAATLLGLSISVYNVSLQTLIDILSKPEERARNFSTAGLTGSVTAFVGPLIAGFAIDQSGHAVACLYVTTISLGATALLALWGNALPGGNRRAVKGMDLRNTLANRGIVRVLALSSLVQIGQDLFQFYIPIYGYGLGLSASAIGGVLAAWALAEFIVRFIMPWMIARVGEEMLLAYSFALAAVGFTLVSFCDNGLALGAVSFVFGFGIGCGHPITTMLVFSHSAAGRSGETFGLRQTANNFMRVTAPTLFGFIVSLVGLTPVFWINALMMGGGVWLARLAARDKRK
jgi:MFS family permease